VVHRGGLLNVGRGPVGRVSRAELFQINLKIQIPNRLNLPSRLQILEKSFLTSVTSETTLLEASESCGRVEDVVTIDPNSSGFDVFGRLERQGHLFGVDGRCKAVDGVVGNANGLLGGSEGQSNEDGAENLFGDDPG
jgi:hypothetical protein